MTETLMSYALLSQALDNDDGRGMLMAYDPMEIIREQEMRQTNVYTADALVTVPEEVLKTRRDLFDTMRQQTSSMVALEALGRYTKVQIRQGELNPSSAKAIYFAMESYAAPVMRNPKDRICDPKMLCSSDTKQQSLALESITDRVNKIALALQAHVRTMMHHTVQLFSHYRSNIKVLHRHIVELQGELHSKIGKEPKFKSIKPEKWCIHLCYPGKGFDVGLQNAMSDISTFIRDHTEMSKHVLEQYVGYFRNLSTESDDVGAFDALTYDPEIFHAYNMVPVQAGKGWRSPKGDNVQYRTRMLPGGQSLYLEASPVPERGLESVDALENIRYKLYPTDSKALERTIDAISVLTSMSITTWLGAVNPMLHLNTTIGDGQHEVRSAPAGHVPQDLMFQTLSLDEVSEVLRGARHAVEALDHWIFEVLETPWKTDHLESIIDRLLAQEQIVSSVKTYANAVLHIASQLSIGIEDHAVGTIKACLLFVEKSLQQYE